MPEQVTISAAEFALYRYVLGLIIEYEPGTRGPTLGYIKERARSVIARESDAKAPEA